MIWLLTRYFTAKYLVPFDAQYSYQKIPVKDCQINFIKIIKIISDATVNFEWLRDTAIKTDLSSYMRVEGFNKDMFLVSNI